MQISRRELAQKALTKSLEVRRQANIDVMSPAPIYEICEALGLTVQFVKLSSMEGMYINKERRILISSLRPLARRYYTCSHELGHHIFNHGCKMDELAEAGQKDDPQEFLVDCFAGFLLMPKLALLNAFTVRGWAPASATPLQVFVISCNFSVGYETIISHMTHTLKMISVGRATELRKSTPKSIRNELIGDNLSTSLIVADEKWASKTIDVETGCQILVPQSAEINSQAGIVAITEIAVGCGKIIRAERPGIVRVFCRDSNWAVFIRVSRLSYEGFSEHRHLEDYDDE
jgi:Zn-dependent peptidase ImmA (M78 family)